VRQQRQQDAGRLFRGALQTGQLSTDPRSRHVYIEIRRRLFRGWNGRRAHPAYRAAATISFAIAPCSLGFVIIAASEQLIRSIMVEMTGKAGERFAKSVSDEAIEANDNYDADW